MSRSLIVRVALTLVVLAHAGLALAQSAGSLRGTVADSTGAVLPGATVTLTNEATKFTRNATSDAKGQYFFARRPGVWLGRIVEGRHWYRPGNHVGGHRIDPGVRRSTWWLSSSNGSRTRWSRVR